MRFQAKLVVVSVLAAALAAPALAADAAKPEAKAKPDETKAAVKPAAKPAEAKPADAKPAICKVKRQPFRIELALDGTFEAKNTADVVLRPEEWSDFEVLRAVEHGTPVKQGELLVSLETEKIDRSIADLQRDLALSKLSLRDTETQLQAARGTTPLELATAQRNKRTVDEDLDRFLKTDRPMFERTAEFMVKTAENSLAYESEELRQLEKMYKADDLTEETEEIILRRARDSVARAKFMFERAKSDYDSIVKVSLPRMEELMKLSAGRQAIDLWKSEISLPAALSKLEISLEKGKTDLERSQLRLDRLVSDRKQMNIKAPISGIVYYGKFVGGKWSGAELAVDKLRRGGRLAANDVFMTIVEPRPLGIRAPVAEKQLQHVTAGMKGTARPTAFPELKLTAIVDRVSAVPSGSKDFDTLITAALDDSARAVMPGMTCQVRFVPYLKPDALAIPVAALGADPLDAERQLVALPDKDGKPVRREVTAGKRNDKLVEILKGLAEGEEIFAEYPKEKE